MRRWLWLGLAALTLGAGLTALIWVELRKPAPMVAHDSESPGEPALTRVDQAIAANDILKGAYERVAEVWPDRLDAFRREVAHHVREPHGEDMIRDKFYARFVILESSDLLDASRATDAELVEIGLARSDVLARSPTASRGYADCYGLAWVGFSMDEYFRAEPASYRYLTAILRAAESGRGRPVARAAPSRSDRQKVAALLKNEGDLSELSLVLRDRKPVEDYEACGATAGFYHRIKSLPVDTAARLVAQRLADEAAARRIAEQRLFSDPARRELLQAVMAVGPRTFERILDAEVALGNGLHPAQAEPWIASHIRLALLDDFAPLKSAPDSALKGVILKHRDAFRILRAENVDACGRLAIVMDGQPIELSPKATAAMMTANAATLRAIDAAERDPTLHPRRWSMINLAHRLQDRGLPRRLAKLTREQAGAASPADRCVYALATYEVLADLPPAKAAELFVEGGWIKDVKAASFYLPGSWESGFPRP